MSRLGFSTLPPQSTRGYAPRVLAQDPTVFGSSQSPAQEISVAILRGVVATSPYVQYRGSVKELL